MLSFDEVMKVRRLEKSASRLVRVEPSFYIELEELIQEEVKNLDPVSLKDARELDNLKNAVSDIYNMREKKILSQALLASRTGSADTDHMAESEKEMYNKVLQLLKPFRDKVLTAFGQTPSEQPQASPEQTPEPVQEPDPTPDAEQSPVVEPETTPEPVSEAVELPVSSPIETVQTTIVPQEQSFNNVPLLILENVPNFVGEDMSEYGPYEKGRRVELPTKVADLLTSRNLAKTV